MSSRTSRDGKFTIERRAATLTVEEIGAVAKAAERAALAAIRIFLSAAYAAETGDPTVLAVETVPAAIEFYEAATKIKEELED